MKPHSKLRKTIKWGGAAVTVLLAALWAASGRWSFSMSMPGGRMVSAGAGHLNFTTVNAPLPWGFSIGRYANHEYVLTWWFERHSSPAVSTTWIPLWFPTLIVLLPAVVAWRLDSLALRNEGVPRCPTCRYDRSGLPLLAACPECGSGSEQVLQS